jgi:acetyltransferase-like isoleucine patch superfamily enzyme
MGTIFYYWSKFFSKLHGKSIINSHIHKTSKVEANSQIVNSTFNKHSFCGYNCEIINCEVGSFCSIANNVVIGGATHPMDWVSTSPVFYEGRDSVKAKFSKHKRVADKKTIIGHDVWIGHSVIIKQGVTIGTGAVIGMGSIVTKDVQPYTIVAGCPAKVIRNRFEDTIIEKLLSSKWWNFNDKDLYEFAQYFNDPNKFISELEK